MDIEPAESRPDANSERRKMRNHLAVVRLTNFLVTFTRVNGESEFSLKAKTALANSERAISRVSKKAEAFLIRRRSEGEFVSAR